MIKHFYLFRHGETDLNAEKRFQGQSCNIGLNEGGRQQAAAFADTLKNKNIEVVVSSPLLRAWETAEIIAGKLGVPLEINRHFIEGNFGEIEGKRREELTLDEMKIFTDWVKLDPQLSDIRFKGGESKSQMQNRAIAGLKALIKQPYQNFAISTHSAVLRVILLYLGQMQHNIPHAHAFHIIWEDGVFRLVDEEKILLLSCCAPCSCAVIEKLAREKKNFSVVFYNPNITPENEYQKRCEENKRLCACYGVEFIELEYDHVRWCALTKGLENEPERGKRCDVCFLMRLKRAMEYAKEHGYTCVASVLGVSRWKNLNQVNRMADVAARVTGCPYRLIEGRKNGMQQQRAALIVQHHLYNQDYCGCPSSQSSTFKENL